MAGVNVENFVKATFPLLHPHMKRDVSCDLPNSSVEGFNVIFRDIAIIRKGEKRQWVAAVQADALRSC